MNGIVPNTFPSQPATRRLAVVGECPGSEEVDWHVCTRCGHGYAPHKSYSGARCSMCGGPAISQPTPFVGQSGRLLTLLLAEVGIQREACFVGNCAQVQAPGNNINLFKWDGPELSTGMAQLRKDLAAYQPHMLLLLGNTPLRHLTGDKSRGIGDWRGSLLLVDGVKAMPTFHPAALLPGRMPEMAGVVRMDMRRLADELQVDGLTLLKRDIVIAHPDEGWTARRIIDWCNVQRELKTPLSFDIEGGIDWIACIGFATCPEFALVVPFIALDGGSVWEEWDEAAIWEAIKGLLEDRTVPKIAQNSLYDCFVLAWSLGIVVDPIADDTMLKHWELYCELEKSLGFQASIYTREPFYKFQRKYAKNLGAADRGTAAKAVGKGADNAEGISDAANGVAAQDSEEAGG